MGLRCGQNEFIASQAGARWTCWTSVGCSSMEVCVKCVNGVGSDCGCVNKVLVARVPVPMRTLPQVFNPGLLKGKKVLVLQAIIKLCPYHTSHPSPRC